MKRLKKLVAMLVAVAICVLVPGANALTVSAAEPVTYHVQYIVDEGEWEFQIGTWNNEVSGRELYYMYNDFKDGDIVVVDTNGAAPAEVLNFSKHIANLTVIDGSQVVVSAPSYGDVFMLLDSRAAITGNVTNAYIYDNAGATFHSNVNTLTMIDTRGELTGTVSVSGTVSHLISKTSSDYIYYQYYNVAAGKLLIDWGTLKTDPSDYSTTPTAAQTSVQAPATQNTQKAPSSGEYDDVPKTGESNIILWLVGVAVLCLTGKQALKKF